MLAYLALVNRQGYFEMSAYDLEEFAESPDQRFGKIDYRIDFSRTLLAERPLETYVEYLSRVGWIVASDSGSAVTPLGQAVLRAMNAPRIDEQDVLEIVLDPDDPFAYARALGELADMPNSMIVDPYFRFEQFVDVVNLGTVTRVLTTRKVGAAALAKLGLGLKAVPADTLHIRVADQLHDRYFVPATGSLRGLGVSLGGVGKQVSVLTTLGAEASDVLRALHESKWENAEPLLPPPDTDGDGESPPPAA